MRNYLNVSDKYLIRRISGDDGFIKLWYSDEVILFDNEEQVNHFIKEFPMFFKGVKYDIVIADLLKSNIVLYRDLLNDKEFLEKKKDIKPKFIIVDNKGQMIRHHKHIITFDNEEEINIFKTTFSSLYKESENKVEEEYTNLAWYLFMDYKDYMKTDVYKDFIKEKEMLNHYDVYKNNIIQ